jgi:hypothetical protein
MRKPPCEWRVKELLPSIRAALAYILINEYNLPIYRASKVLGVTPAAVSNYLSAKRSKSKIVRSLLDDPESYSELKNWTRKLLNHEMEIGDVICSVCQKLSKWEHFL